MMYFLNKIKTFLSGMSFVSHKENVSLNIADTTISLEINFEIFERCTGPIFKD